MSTRTKLMATVVAAVLVSGGVCAYRASRHSSGPESRYARVLARVALPAGFGRGDFTVVNTEVSAEQFKAVYAQADPRLLERVVNGLVHAQTLTVTGRGRLASVWYAVLKRPDLAKMIYPLEYRALAVRLDGLEEHGARVVDNPRSGPLKGIEADFANKTVYSVDSDGVTYSTTQTIVVRGPVVVGMTFRGVRVSDRRLVDITEGVFRRLRPIVPYAVPKVEPATEVVNTQLPVDR